MNRTSIVLAGALIVALAACGWLYRENRALHAQLSTPVAAEAAEPEDSADAAPAGTDGETVAASPDKPPRRSATNWMFRRQRAEPPKVEVEEPKPESRGERRQRRQAEIAAMFGRLDGETEDEYRERMVPFIRGVLSTPRERLGDARKSAEEAANITDEQRAQIDEVMDDAYRELITLTNEAVS
ncbi:MAG: hypothetical protein AAGC55_22270, partial [Myxococcota bacterium]